MVQASVQGCCARAGSGAAVAEEAETVHRAIPTTKAQVVQAQQALALRTQVWASSAYVVGTFSRCGVHRSLMTKSAGCAPFPCALRLRVAALRPIYSFTPDTLLYTRRLMRSPLHPCARPAALLRHGLGMPGRIQPLHGQPWRASIGRHGVARTTRYRDSACQDASSHGMAA